MKKQSQVGIIRMPIIDLKRREMRDLIANMSRQIEEVQRMPDISQNEKITRMNAVITNFGNQIDGKVNEIRTQMTIQKAEDKLPGGVADEVDYDKLNKKQLEMGQEVELEHTDDLELAREIAADHLAEQLEGGKEKDEQDYYTELKKIDPHVNDFISKRHAYFQGGGGVNQPQKYEVEEIEKAIPRGDGEKVQMFWKNNLDYWESPYKQMDELDKITDYKELMIDDGRFKKK